MGPPFIPVALKVTDVPAQTGLAAGVIDTLTGRFGLTVIAIELEMAGFPVAQVASEVRTQVITSPLFGVYEYVVLVAPGIFVPPTLHWYNGPEPPFIDVDVKVTIVPAQTVFAEAVIEILTGRFGFAVMITVFDVAGLLVAQVASEVSTQVIASPLRGI